MRALLWLYIPREDLFSLSPNSLCQGQDTHPTSMVIFISHLPLHWKSNTLGSLLYAVFLLDFWLWTDPRFYLLSLAIPNRSKCSRSLRTVRNLQMKAGFNVCLPLGIPTEGEQNVLPQNMSLRHITYFELKLTWETVVKNTLTLLCSPAPQKQEINLPCERYPSQYQEGGRHPYHQR